MYFHVISHLTKLRKKIRIPQTNGKAVLKQKIKCCQYDAPRDDRRAHARTHAHRFRYRHSAVETTSHVFPKNEQTFNKYTSHYGWNQLKNKITI